MDSSNYFLKLNHKFDLPDVSVGPVNIQYGIEVENNFYGIWYNSLQPKETYLIKDLLPEKFLDGFCVDLMQVNCLILPHIDSNVKCVVNFYVKTEECITQFYDIKPGANPYKIPNQTNGCIYNLDDLIPGPSFIANPGDVYLLDITKPHSVTPLTDGLINRVAFCAGSTKLSYEEIKNLLT